MRAMPVSFSFTRRCDGQVVPCQVIDDLICEALGRAPDPELFSLEYDVITNVGILATLHGAWCQDRFEDCVRGAGCPVAMLARRFLLEEYEFSSWR